MKNPRYKQSKDHLVRIQLFSIEPIINMDAKIEESK